MWFSLHKMDCVEFLRTLPDESVDLVVTDPAYESLEKHRSTGTTTRLTREWFDIFPNTRFPEFFTELYRVLAPDRHLYVYCDLDTAKVIDPIGERAGFKMWNWITWDKRRLSMGYHYRRRKEFIVFFEKGQRKLADLGIGDVLDDFEGDHARGVEIISETRVVDGYPTEKPVGVSEILISQSARPGEIVVDPFMGSASVGHAAINKGCHFIGSDISEKSIDMARVRLGAVGEHKQFPIFNRPTQSSFAL